MLNAPQWKRNDEERVIDNKDFIANLEDSYTQHTGIKDIKDEDIIEFYKEKASYNSNNAFGMYESIEVAVLMNKDNTKAFSDYQHAWYKSDYKKNPENYLGDFDATNFGVSEIEKMEIDNVRKITK